MIFHWFHWFTIFSEIIDNNLQYWHYKVILTLDEVFIVQFLWNIQMKYFLNSTLLINLFLSVRWKRKHKRSSKKGGLFSLFFFFSSHSHFIVFRFRLYSLCSYQIVWSTQNFFFFLDFQLIINCLGTSSYVIFDIESSGGTVVLVSACNLWDSS